MKHRRIISIYFSILLFNCLAGSAFVYADDALAKKNNCLACHATDSKLIGPAYKEIAAKYKGDDSALGNLVEKIKSGGGGIWGDIPMPPNAAVSDEDAKTLVNWILSM